MPYFICQNEECGHRFFKRSELAAMSGCPVCEEGEVILEDSDWDAVAPAKPHRRAHRMADARNEAERLLQRHKIIKPPVNVERITAHQSTEQALLLIARELASSFTPGLARHHLELAEPRLRRWGEPSGQAYGSEIEIEVRALDDGALVDSLDAVVFQGGMQVVSADEYRAWLESELSKLPQAMNDAHPE